MKQNITPSFRRDAFSGLSFNPYLNAGAPEKSYFGYKFATAQTLPVFSGWFAPHSILSPSKDTVNIKAWVHWTFSDLFSVFSPLGVDLPVVGWLVTMEILRENQSLDAPHLKRTLSDVKIDLDPHMVALAARTQNFFAPWGVAAGGFLSPIAEEYDSNGHVDWSYDIIPPFGDRFQCVHPYSQMALGYQRMTTQRIDMGMGLETVLFPTVYKTPVLQIRKNSNGLYLDDKISFNELSRRIDGYDSGVGFAVYRMQAQTVGGGTSGDIPDGVFGTDNFPGDVTFLGLEIEIV